MSKHTPGNWYAAFPFYVHSDHEGIVEGTHTLVCRASSIDDAILIAAAPEMYDVILDIIGYKLLDGEYPLEAEVLNKMADILAKIRGEQ